jgi:hypothetical protein
VTGNSFATTVPFAARLYHSAGQKTTV